MGVEGLSSAPLLPGTDLRWREPQGVTGPRYSV